MPSVRLTIALATTALTFGLMFAMPSAHAQQPNPANPTQQPGPPVDKPDGVAEQAPKEKDLLPTVPILPPERSRKKAFELLELDGYFRFRGDWFKKFHLGFFEDPAGGGAPFPQPSACTPTEGVNKPCEEAVKTANIRLRLEPTININEKTRVHMQVDVLDNVVLGSTPDSFFGDGTAPRGDRISGAFSDGQVAPEAGRNWQSESIRVKRAWAEVETAFGLIKFGRMPDHWGLGIYANEGGRDPVHGGVDLDSDFGDTEDRVMFSTLIPGTDIIGAVALDWSSVAPTSAQSGLLANRYGGQAWDLDDNDDVNQYVLMISRRDSPKTFTDKVAQGGLALNYGVYFVYRTQGFDQTGVTLGETPPADQFVPRSLKVYTPDFWARLGYKNIELEFEGVTTIGSMEASDLGVDGELKIRQFGAVLRSTFRFFDGDLRLGAEFGWASGDSQDNAVQGELHASGTVLPSGDDTTFNKFFFDFDYNVDLILFRELYGTITNAMYFKPSLEYDINSKIRAKAWPVISFAHKPIATPGNQSGLGVELDADVSYHDDASGFSAGFAYGVLFPLGGMNHPTHDPGTDGGPGFGYGPDNVGDAQTAQTIQLRMMLQF